MVALAGLTGFSMRVAGFSLKPGLSRCAPDLSSWLGWSVRLVVRSPSLPDLSAELRDFSSLVADFWSCDEDRSAVFPDLSGKVPLERPGVPGDPGRPPGPYGCPLDFPGCPPEEDFEEPFVWSFLSGGGWA